MSEIERRIFSMSSIRVEKRDDDSKTPVIRGHAAVFDKLSENLGGFREKISPGAFDDVLKDDVRALFNHDSNLILGRTSSKTLQISVDSEGLLYDIEPPDTQVARDLLVSIDRGDVRESSFAFQVEDDKWEEDEDGRIVRSITKFKRLYDVSPVTYPAYPDASVGLRSMEEAFKRMNDWKESRSKQYTKSYVDVHRELKLRIAEVS